jgi:hypothetical protein
MASISFRVSGSRGALSNCFFVGVEALNAHESLEIVQQLTW